jgi:hypothetical protein
MRFRLYYRVTDAAGRVRLESVREQEAVDHAQAVYRAEKAVCVIEEIDRGE